MRSSKNMLPAVLCAVMLGMSVHPALAQANRTAPNIILIIGDDVGYGDFGCYGNPYVRTPNIDRIASAGLKFTGFFLTTSSCSPSRASIISGRYPHNTGAAELHTPLPPEIISFPALLKAGGYYTAASGKWHLGEAAKRGFDVVHDSGGSIGEGGENMWLQTLQERPRDKPFFLWLASIDAHRPWRQNEFAGTHVPDDIIVPPYLANTPQTRMDIASYYDEITRFDHFIGIVENELQQQGVLDNTIIIIMSDNGAAYPRAKSRLYDAGIKTPFIMSWPALMAGRSASCSSLVSAIDIAPTLLELAGIERAPALQGRSFSALLHRPSRKFRNYVFAEHNWHDYQALERMVRTKNLLYILNLRPSLSNPGPADVTKSIPFDDLKQLRDAGKLSIVQSDIFIAPRSAEELYDSRKDPLQIANLASSPNYRTKIRRLRKILRQWKIETADSYPDNITGDWFSREDGTPLADPRVKIRGEMPGGQEARRVIKGGPF